MAALRTAAALAWALALGLAAAEPSGQPRSLRGPSLNRTDNLSAPAIAPAVLNLSAPALAAAPGVLSLPAQALATAPGAPNATAPASDGAEALMAAKALAVAGGDIDANSNFYYDGECKPCPAYLYGHCSRGGRLVGRRRCGAGGAYCEGLCEAPDEPGVMTLYHETSPEIAELILANGFKPGSRGWCGGAIYFFNSPDVPPTKLGADSHSGAVIEAKVDMGRMAHLGNRCDGWYQARTGYDSITFNPGDGPEFVIFSKDRVLSAKRYK